MKNLILTHQDPEEIQKIFLSDDLKKWNEQLLMAQQELKFYNNVLVSDLVQILKTNPEDAVYLNKNLVHFENENEKFILALLNFSNDLEKINECEDLSCDTYYLNQHANFRVRIEAHFSELRSLKMVAIEYLNKGLLKYLQ